MDIAYEKPLFIFMLLDFFFGKFKELTEFLKLKCVGNLILYYYFTLKNS